MEDKYNTESYNLYKNTVVKLLDDSLVEGEYFLFTKTKEGGFGIILSEERWRDVDSPKFKKLLKILKSEDEELNTFYTGKISAKKD